MLPFAVILLITFATSMKKIAYLFLFVFFLMQLSPILHIPNTDTVAVFVADEQNGEEKNNGNDNSEKKYYPVFTYHSQGVTAGLSIVPYCSEDIMAAPCPETPTPPPNFC